MVVRFKESSELSKYEVREFEFLKFKFKMDISRRWSRVIYLRGCLGNFRGFF